MSKSLNTAGTRSIDMIAFGLYLSLMLIGVITVYSVGSRQNYDRDAAEFIFGTTVGKQMIFIAVSLFMMFTIMLTDWKFWRNAAYVIYGFSLILLISVLFFGTVINGAKAWFLIGGFSFQPVEIAKFGTALALSSFLMTADMRTWKSMGGAAAILILPVVLIMLQPDAGSSLVFVSLLLMLYREGMTPVPLLLGLFFAAMFILSIVFDVTWVSLGIGLSVSAMLLLTTRLRNWKRWLLLIATCGAGIATMMLGYQMYAYVFVGAVTLLLIAVHWHYANYQLAIVAAFAVVAGVGVSLGSDYAFKNILAPHQQERINVWLRPHLTDPRGAAYNLTHSKMAIGSGGLVGKGLMEGTMTKLNYVPEQLTDFIFCGVGEEQGFIGTAGVILIYLMLLMRIIVIAERQKFSFSRHYAYAVACIIFTHFFVNIGMTMGIMPIIGIPLPFISSGGSSMIGFTLMLAVLLKLDSDRYAV